jgi:hypothetical protein
MKVDSQSVAIAALCVLSAGLGIALVHRNRSIVELRRSADALEQRARAQEPRPAVARHRPGPRTGAPASKDQPPAAPAAPGQTAAKGDGARSFLGGLAAMMNQPAMRDSIRQHQAAAIDTLYGPFLASAELTPDQRDRLKELLSDKLMAGADNGLRILDPNLSKEQRAALAKELEAGQKTVDTRIKELLGERVYADFHMYEESQPERQQIDSFKRALETDGLELSIEQEKGLMDMMYAERKTSPAGAGMAKVHEAMRSGEMELTDERIAEMVNEQNQLHERIAARAATILDADQLAAFKRNQERARAMHESALRMSSQLFRKTAP